METNAPTVSITGLDDAGILTGIAAFDDGELDRNGRRYVAGAFGKSLAAHKQAGTMPAMLLHHDFRRPVGSWLDIKPEGSGLKVRGQIVRDTADGAEAYSLVKASAIRFLSTGALHEKTEPAAAHKPGEMRGTVITEADLLEISLVSVPGNRNTPILRVSSMSGARDIEEILHSAGLSSRKAKAAAAAAWRAIQSKPDADDDAVRSILTAAKNSLSRFHRSTK
ncbi:HK97 family phage prohead protease [Sphingomonas sp. BIUV-7]|uniref:HK97 family phage prohead protease n=1 Tax=Sphingomonas natans TaxID=3063330 RepID=A0ABT8Y6T5_9SPHN|nr:HK97 family phage prohead protease [Sphingomonas sp. BIUV-7]MDO6414033.1 HK97 family phage prohead protease [Sphingomonas sp. BIUV-7]